MGKKISTKKRVKSAGYQIGLMMLLFVFQSYGQMAYIPNYQLNNNVTIVNLSTNAIVSTISAGDHPSGVCVTPDGSKVYMANTYGNTVTVISTASNTVVTTIAVGGGPIGICSSPDGSKIYVAHAASNNVYVINTSTNTVSATIPAGVGAYGVVASPNGSKVYVSNYNNNTVSVLDAINNTLLTTISVGSNPSGICISPDGNTVYVTNQFSANVSVISAATNTVTTTINVGLVPYGICITPDGSKIYVANQNSNTVSIINAASNTVSATVAVGANPTGVCLSQDASKLYVASYNENSMYVITTATDIVSTSFACGNSPYAFGNITVSPTPAGCSSAPAAPIVSGPDVVCQMLTATYTASSAGATSYTWETLPTGMTYFAGYTNHSNPLKVNIAAGTLTGNITATATNTCGTSGVTQFLVTKKPGLTNAITSSSLCGNTTATYSVSPVSNTNSYLWSVPSGLTITGPTNGTSITVSKSPAFIVGNISVSAVNACGFVPGTSLTVYGQVPVIPATISGPSSVCAGNNNYATSGSTGATGYVWSVTGNASVAGAGKNAIATMAPNFASGILSVTATNTCGSSYTKTKSITKATGCFAAPIALDNANESTLFNLYPNPTNGNFTIFVENQDERIRNQDLTIEVYDVLGNKVLQSLIQNSQSEISLESFRNGMYFVRVVDSNSNTVYSQRVIKN